MSKLYAVAVSVVLGGLALVSDRARALNAEDSERGSLSTEQVIVTAALVAVALLVVGAITLAVNGRLSGIF